MQRPIDANALREEIKKNVYVVDGMCNVYQILHNIDTAPTIDAEPVVRCKDCKNSVLRINRIKQMNTNELAEFLRQFAIDTICGKAPLNVENWLNEEIEGESI